MGNRARGNPLLPVIIQQEPVNVRIPVWVIDHASFRRWAQSSEYPDRGRYAFLDGELWVDTSMERFIHNQLKTQIAATLTQMATSERLGHYLSDRMMLSHEEVGLSTEPDGMLVSHESLESGKCGLEGGEEAIEVVGTPDMVLEVVSPTSRQKDLVVLRELYWRAGIPEYWIVEPQKDGISFDILRRGIKGYSPVRKRAGRLKSEVFAKSFELKRLSNEEALPTYVLRAS